MRLLGQSFIWSFAHVSSSLAAALKFRQEPVCGRQAIHLGLAFDGSHLACTKCLAFRNIADSKFYIKTFSFNGVKTYKNKKTQARN
jgi:hypothetical protein